MSKLNLIAIVAIVAAVSLIVGMAAPAFAQGNTTKSSAGSMPGMNMGGNSTNATSAAAGGNSSAPAANSTK